MSRSSVQFRAIVLGAFLFLAAAMDAQAQAFKCGAFPITGHALAKASAQADFIAGTRKVLVIRVGFPDAPFTNDSAAMAAVNDSVTQLYNSMSRAKFGWSFKMHPGVITTPNFKATYFGQGRQVNDALIAFVNSKLTELGLKAGTDYHHYVVNHPRDTTLPYEGSSGYPNPDQWMNGTFRALVLGHEIGHGLGLPHAAEVVGVSKSGTFRIYAHDQPANADMLGRSRQAVHGRTANGAYVLQGAVDQNENPNVTQGK